jgi:ATP-dependent Clp protease ATP-binding subunit ClpA
VTDHAGFTLTQVHGPSGTLSFDRYTDRARRVLVLAQEDARSLNHAEIGTGHLLTGMLGEGEAVAFRALDAFGVTAEAARAALFDCDPPGTTPAGTEGIPFSRQGRKVLELALREALLLGHNYIGTEHLLLGIVREGDGTAAQVLVKLGADLNRVRQKVIELLHGYEKPALSAHVSIRFPADLASATAAVAARDGMDMSAWIRRVVDRELAARSGKCPTCGHATEGTGEGS